MRLVPEIRPDEPDLAWLAFRYAAGELTDAEASAFEIRMDEDQAAREALADAVGLIAALASQAPATLPLPSLAPAHRHAIRHALGWMVAGAAACLAAMIGLQATWPSPRPRGPDSSPVAAATGSGAPSAVEPTGTLALTWSDLNRVAVEADAEAGCPADWLDEPFAPEGEMGPASMAVADPPTWLLEATALPDVGEGDFPPDESTRGL